VINSLRAVYAPPRSFIGSTGDGFSPAYDRGNGHGDGHGDGIGGGVSKGSRPPMMSPALCFLACPEPTELTCSVVNTLCRMQP
jgi:hypothetical protein